MHQKEFLYMRLGGFIALLLALIALPLQAAAPDYLTPYNALLSTYVHPGEKEGIHAALIDYKGWAADKTHAMAVKQLQLVKPGTLPEAARTAFWINAYNLLTIDLIVQHQEKVSIKNIGSVLDDPWKTFKWPLAGRDMTLADIEHELPTRNNVRLRMALCNGALSAPDLRTEAYNGGTLDTQLDDAVRTFLKNEAKGLKIRGTVLEVSKLFEWFANDFEVKGGAAAFLRQYHPATPVKGVVQGYFDYNWGLNGQWE